MAFDALRGYVQLANGLTDVTRQRATQVAKQLLDQGGGVVDLAVSTAVSGNVARQAQSLAEDLLATSRTNRDLLVGLVRTEVERTVGRLGLVGADELAAMLRVVERLQSQLDAAIAFGGGDDPAAETSADQPSRKAAAPAAPRRQAAAKKVAVRKAAAKAVVKKAPAKKAPAKKAPAKKAPAKKAPAKKAPAKKVAAPTASVPTAKVVKKAASKKAAAKKTVAGSGTSPA